jgi:AraC-like DNA-binding protein
MSYFINNPIKKEFTDGIPGHVAEAQYFYFDTQDASQKSLSILCGGYEKCAGDFELDRNHFPFYTIELTVGGKGTFACGNQTHPLYYGKLTAYGPNTPHYFKADSVEPMEHIFIIFLGRDADTLFKQSDLYSKNSILVADPDFIASLMRHILKVGFDKSGNAEQIICCYLKAILLGQTDASPAIYSASPSMVSFNRCKSYLDHHFERIDSCAQLAQHCHLDIRYIARLFKRYKQIRPYEYLIQLKMNKAASLLLTTNFSVKQVAQITGIKDPYHFSRLFKKIFKKAPSQYRKLLG